MFKLSTLCFSYRQFFKNLYNNDCYCYNCLPFFCNTIFRLRHTRCTCTSHYLQIITTMIVLNLSVTPFFRLRHSSAEKEGKSAVLDYWQFKVLHSALICFTNPASPNFFTGRAGFVLRTHTAHLPKSASWICFALVAVVDFTSLSSTSHSLTELTQFVRVTRPQIRKKKPEDLSSGKLPSPIIVNL